MDHEIEVFIRDYLKEVREDNAAVFAGAGLSAREGCVNWRDLLRPIAEELNLDIDREHDLVAVAQYHCNENAGNRHRLNQLLIERLTVGVTPTENHGILARLPISTYWTTNYDALIETALKDGGKIPDVKYTTEQLATTKPRRDAVVYKMHGDVEHPHDAVLIKDDYEKYHLKRGAFINALAGDLVSKMFLFIGFSFTDPNLDYVLSRIRITFRENQKRHYCFFKKRTKLDSETNAEFEHAQVKQRLAIEDLKRFNIKTLLIEDYAQITEILARIERQYRQHTIFISGSAVDYGAWTKADTEEFLRDLSRALVKQGYRLATGVGLGVGDAIITGAVEEIYRARTGHIEDALILRPFPQATADSNARQQLWESYRQELIPMAGVCLFILGNKKVGDETVPADGVRREFEIAVEHGLSVVPIGSTGYMARELWEEVRASIEGYFPNGNDELKMKFDALGIEVERPSELISKILDFITHITKE
jgi:hypothetical protein